MRFREFQPADWTACLALFEGNTPDYFHPSEREAFLESLEGSDFRPPALRGSGEPKGRFYVVEDEGAVIGCGGWYLDGAVAVLSWGMVRRSRHREGVGRLFLNERLKMIRQNEHVKSVRVRTTPSVQGFFLRAGFKVVAESVTGVVDEMPLVELILTF